ncbi:MAG: ATP-grasp domain-containing protein [Propionibacteriaceae bacterium]|jgi:acetyl-CoA/propionyl-CoA carboxylase biotin carboxyl carrier protein|nr:ATP-grasp domain-containing protein [Propionibacteriaceae bacterium]
MKKVLIANRGEIAVRIIRACASYGLKSVAVYADADANAHHVRLADEAYCLEGRTALETYLDAGKILKAAKASGADAIHPGYGFLAERADFAAAVEEAGLTWIGPTPENIALLGDKVAARRIAEQVGAPLVPGTPGPVSTVEEVRAFAEVYGYPIAIKAAFGGGGRGLKVVFKPEELERRYESAVSEAVSAFGRGECYVERFVDRPRHVETQIIGDGQGRVVVVGTRDCSLQRRHQKVVEEAPAPFLTDEQHQQLADASIAIGAAVNYRGVGTMEFMLGSDGSLSFLEVNTRIQVEHTITERTTGVDLVIWQFMIAEGSGLESLPDVVPSQGHAIEFRINAEDPGRGFLPQAGKLTRFDLPAGPFVRVDEGMTAGGVISPEFDSLIAKVIVWGNDRTEAIARGRQAMKEAQIDGIPTLIPFDRRILTEPAFIAEDAADFKIHTNWIETECDWLPELAQPLPQGVTRESVVREWFEVDGRWIRLGFPAAFLGSGAGGAPNSAPVSAAPSPEIPTGAIRAPMNGVLSRWFVPTGSTVTTGTSLGALEAMKMEMPLIADQPGVFAALVKEGTVVKEGQPIATIA